MAQAVEGILEDADVTLGRQPVEHDAEKQNRHDAEPEVGDGDAADRNERGQGIGRAAALIFAREGANVICTDVDAEGNQQAVVLELGKKIVRTTLAGLSARSGLKVEFEDEKAREALGR